MAYSDAPERIMSKFTLTINTNNAAFDNSANIEVARILHELAGRLEAAVDTEASYFVVVDGNGNKVGAGELVEALEDLIEGVPDNAAFRVGSNVGKARAILAKVSP